MRIEEAIGMSADQLEAMTPEQCKAHFDHYLIVTRPEQQPKAIKQEQRVMSIDPKFAQAQAIAKQLGINLPTFKPMKGKK